MDFTKILAAGLAVLIATGGVAAAGTGVGTQAASDSTTSTTNVDTHATYDNGTVTLTVVDAGEPFGNVSVYAEEEFVDTTDANGTLTFTSNGSDDLEIELAGHDFEGELEYDIRNGSLVLTEEEYEYERDGEADEEREDNEEREDEGHENEDEEREDEEREDEEREDDNEEREDDDDEREDEEREDDDDD